MQIDQTKRRGYHGAVAAILATPAGWPYQRRADLALMHEAEEDWGR